MNLFKLLAVLSSGALVGSTATTFATKLTINHKNSNNLFSNLKLKSRQGNNIKLGSGFSITHHHNYKSDSAQEIINKIINKEFMVPNDTIPNANNPQTIKTIKQYLQKNNSNLTDADLNCITLTSLIPGAKLQTSSETGFSVFVQVGSDNATTFIHVKLSAQPVASINLYSPLVGPTNNYSLESDYYDDVFLKTLTKDNTGQLISDPNKLSDAQDKTDYAYMAKQNCINQGLVMLNRYIDNKFLKFTAGAYIPPRPSLLNNTNAEKQKVITLTNQFSTINISNLLSLDFHWDHISVNLKPALMANVIKDFINISISDVLKNNNYAKWTDVSSKFKTDMTIRCVAFNYAVSRVFELIPEVGVVLGPIIEIILEIISEQIVGGIMKLMYSATDTSLTPPPSHIVNNLDQLWYSHCPGYPEKQPSAKDGILFKIPHDKAAIPIGINMRISYAFPLLLSKFGGVYMDNSTAQLADAITPSKFNTSLQKPSVITGNSNDFTLAINGADVKTIYVAFEFNYTIEELFNALNLDPNKVQNYQLNDFKDIYNHNYNFSSSDVSIVFHIVNQKVVWTNINNSAEDALPTPDGNLVTSFIKENNTTNLLVNSSIINKIQSDIIYAKTNWNTLKNTPNVKSHHFTIYEQYIAYYDFGQNNINKYQINAVALVDKLTSISNGFANGVKMSYLNSGIPKIMNIYYSDNNFIVQV